jgi:F-type H+-transporting ATPase subunit b
MTVIPAQLDAWLLAAGKGPDLQIWIAVMFLILVGVLLRFAWGPLTGALDGRQRGIEDHIEAAKKQHDQAKALLAQYEQKLAGAAAEVKEMLAEAKRDAEQTRVDILSEAKAAAQAEHDRAVRDVRNAKDAALKEIGEAGADFAVELAAKIVAREVTPGDHVRLIRDAVAQFPNPN